MKAIIYDLPRQDKPRPTSLIFRIAALTAALTILLIVMPASALAATGSYPSVRFMRSAPNDSASVITEIPANTQLTVHPVSGTQYAKTTYNGVTGYVKHLKFSYASSSGGESVSNAPSGGQSSSASAYYLFVNKSANTMTVYKTDASGRRTDEVVKQFTVGIGKRSTPTPTGTFKLGGKEEWHFFGKSYAPFAIRFAGGKYIHGPLYTSKDTSALVSSSLSGIGDDVTGGCLRMSYSDAQWVYGNCSGGTTLEIVNGQ